MPIYEDNTKSIGHTPLVRINRLDASSAAITDALIFMAVAMAVTRTIRLAVGRTQVRSGSGKALAV